MLLSKGKEGEFSKKGTKMWCLVKSALVSAIALSFSQVSAASGSHHLSISLASGQFTVCNNINSRLPKFCEGLPDSLRNSQTNDSIPKVWQVVDTYSDLMKQYKKIDMKRDTTAVDAILDIDGMVVDETQSKMGKDFYDVFFRLWDSPMHNVNYTIVIDEKPMPSLGTQIIVKVDDRVVYQNFLRPKYEAIEVSAYTAVEYARHFLQIFKEANFY